MAMTSFAAVVQPPATEAAAAGDESYWQQSPLWSESQTVSAAAPFGGFCPRGSGGRRWPRVRGRPSQPSPADTTPPESEKRVDTVRF